MNIEVLLKHALDHNSDRYVGDVVGYGAATRASICAANNRTYAACERSLSTKMDAQTLPRGVGADYSCESLRGGGSTFGIHVPVTQSARRDLVKLASRIHHEIHCNVGSNFNRPLEYSPLVY
jgi:hypothetical protein